MKKLFAAIFVSSAFYSGLSATCQPYTFVAYPNEYFVETGCHEGHGIDLALKSGFKQIYSIELFPYYVNFCRERFATNPNVHIVEGDSAEILYDVIEKMDRPITFWLDAHFVNDYATLGYDVCPLLNELEAIKKHPIKTHTILIDDIRFCRGADEYGNKYDFPSLDQLIAKILEINPKYQISYVTGHTSQDILVAKVSR